MDDLEARLDRVLESGDPAQGLEALEQRDPGLIDEIIALSPDYPGLASILAKLNAFVGDQAATPTLDVEDFYRPGVTPYALHWPLAPPTLAVLPMGFEALDHKTQFYVLFQEWTRRELEANQALNVGDLTTAQAVFEECLARAEQLDVAELRARSHEGLATVYDKVNDRNAARREFEAALADRAGAAP
jgi:hypothetical protein